MRPETFLKRLDEHGLLVGIHPSGRIVLGGPKEKISLAREALEKFSRLEAKVLVILSRRPDLPEGSMLADLLEERAAILEADELPFDIESAAFALIGPWTPEDTET
jgi:hypothetical protein